MATKLEFEQKPRWVLSLMDSLVMIRRSSTHIVRNTDQLLGTFFQPIMFLVLFTAVFGGAIATGSENYTDFLMAGIIVQTIAFGSTTTAIAICNDLQRGIVDRFRSLPMSNLAVLTGHVVSDLFRNGISTVVMILAGLLIGFRPTATVQEWLLFIGLIALFTLAISWLAAIVGLLAKSVEGVQWMTFVVIMPLTFASTAFVPAESMTAWLRPFAENQPVSQMVDAVRALLVGAPAENSILLAAVWSVAILVVSMPVAAWLFKRKTSQ